MLPRSSPKAQISPLSSQVGDNTFSIEETLVYQLSKWRQRNEFLESQRKLTGSFWLKIYGNLLSKCGSENSFVQTVFSKKLIWAVLIFSFSSFSFLFFFLKLSVEVSNDNSVCRCSWELEPLFLSTEPSSTRIILLWRAFTLQIGSDRLQMLHIHLEKDSSGICFIWSHTCPQSKQIRYLTSLHS